jgi:ankyrin repeat protein
LVNGNERELGHALQLPKQYSMVRIEKGIINIHRLVQRVIRLELQKQSKEQQILSKALKLIYSADNSRGNDSHLMSIWDYASKYGELIDHYSFKYVYDRLKITSLHLLAQNGRYKTIKAILTYTEKNHSNELTKIINAIDIFGNTPLHFAAKSGNLDLVKYLIEEKGADFNAPDNDGKIALHFAARWAKLDVVKYLIEEKGADFNAPDNDGKIALHFAAESGELDLVKYLIEEKGADFNTPDNDGETPLHSAASWGTLDVVKYLIEEKGADFNALDKCGKTPLHSAAFAAGLGKLDVVKYLKKKRRRRYFFERDCFPL